MLRVRVSLHPPNMEDDLHWCAALFAKQRVRETELRSFRTSSAKFRVLRFRVKRLVS